jgi:LmbE family N-acetylglucosaminyl deacetylase
MFGCGGTIARHCAAGDHVEVVIVTRGIPELWPHEAVEQILGEARAANQFLGVKRVNFLGFPAPKLDQVPMYSLADSIRKVVNDVRPHVMYVPHRGDIHHDHQAVHRAACVAARPSQELVVERILSYETPSETEWAASGDDAFVPNVFVDISPYLERKLCAISHYRSQLKPPPHPRSLETIKAMARFRGSVVCAEAAEAFVLVREYMPGFTRETQ